MSGPFELRIDDNFPALIDVPIFVTGPYQRQAVRKWIRNIELRIDDEPALRIDITPASSNFDRRESFLELALVIELGVDGDLAGFCDVAIFAALPDGEQARSARSAG